MRIVIAPNSFKGTLTAPQAAAAIAEGFRRALPDANLLEIPLADGGEGTAEVLVKALGGSLRHAVVCGPLGDPVSASFGFVEGSATAVIEMAAASGLLLVPESRRDVLRASTFGTGQLMQAAIAAGATTLLITIGGSATCDGGAGMAQALGVRLLDRHRRPLPDGIGGGALADIHAIDPAPAQAHLAGEAIKVLCDVRNPLLGPTGSARVYAPQKGATPADVERLEQGLEHLADLVRRDLGIDVRELTGGGAAGGLGAGLHAFAGGRLVPGAETVLATLDLQQRCRHADAIVAGEGRLDDQSMSGKVVSAVADLGRRLGVPVYVIAGQADLPARQADFPFAGVAAIANSQCSRNAATGHAEALARTAHLAARDWFVR